MKLVAVHSRIPEPTRSRPARSRDSSPGSTGGSVKTGPSSSGYASRNSAQERRTPSQVPVSAVSSAAVAGGVSSIAAAM